MRSRTQFLNLLSHGLSFVVMFAFLSGFFEDGIRATPYFLVTSLFTLFLWMGIGQKLSPLFRLLAGVGIYLCGALGWFWLERYVNSAHLTLYFIVGLCSFYRMSQVKVDFQYLRDQLTKYYRQDLLIMILLAFITWIYAQDPTWQSTGLFFFIAYLLTRLWALSSAVQTGPQGQGRISRLLFFTVFPTALLGMLVLEGLGFPLMALLWDLILYLATPIIYLAGAISFAVARWLILNPQLRELLEGMENGTGEKEERTSPPIESTFQIPEWLSSLLFGLLLLYFAWSLYRHWKRGNRGFLSDDYVEEVREFLPGRKATPGKVRFAKATTPIRKLYQQFLGLMIKRGHSRQVGETPSEYGKRMGSKHPTEKAWIMGLTEHYMKERYGEKEEKKASLQARELLRRITQRKG